MEVFNVKVKPGQEESFQQLRERFITLAWNTNHVENVFKFTVNCDIMQPQKGLSGPKRALGTKSGPLGLEEIVSTVVRIAGRSILLMIGGGVPEVATLRQEHQVTLVINSTHLSVLLPPIIYIYILSYSNLIPIFLCVSLR